MTADELYIIEAIFTAVCEQREADEKILEAEE